MHVRHIVYAHNRTQICSCIAYMVHVHDLFALKVFNMVCIDKSADTHRCPMKPPVLAVLCSTTGTYCTSQLFQKNSLSDWLA